MAVKIGFMQGRLSPVVSGKIQAFPRDHWRLEFPIAQRMGISVMEWTLDQEGIYQNPLMAESGHCEIRSLCHQYDVVIPSITGDCFMQAPFWKHDGQRRVELQDDLKNVINNASQLGIKFVVIPLVDSGNIESAKQELALLEYLDRITPLLESSEVQILFESDFEPKLLKQFISKLSPLSFGINYDSGNSAALGYDPDEEFLAYGDRVRNVHIKDRLFGGATVALGYGDTDFDRVFSCLSLINYDGNLILQTARSEDNDHEGTLARFHQNVNCWVERYGL